LGFDGSDRCDRFKFQGPRTINARAKPGGPDGFEELAGIAGGEMDGTADGVMPLPQGRKALRVKHVTFLRRNLRLCRNVLRLTHDGRDRVTAPGKSARSPDPALPVAPMRAIKVVIVSRKSTVNTASASKLHQNRFKCSSTRHKNKTIQPLNQIES
jgi:hypothetical protein